MYIWTCEKTLFSSNLVSG